MVKLRDQGIDEMAEKALSACLENIPFMKVAEVRSEKGEAENSPDRVFRLTTSEGEKVLIAEVKNSGQPRLARGAVSQLLRYRNVYPGSYGVFMAPYISSASAEICRKEGVGYVDFAGNCFLSFDRVFISREGNPNPFTEKRIIRSLYYPKAARILRVLLSEPKKSWRIQELSKQASVSLGQASNVKRLLEDREWVKRQADGFRLVKPEELLKEWAAHYTFRKNEIREFYTLKNPVDIEADLAEVCGQKTVEYALTGFSAAARLAPAVRYQRVMAYVGAGLDEVAARLGLKEVTSGSNVTLMDPFDQAVFYGDRLIDGVRIVSPIQAYLDLKGFRGRGEEAANAIFEEVLRPSW
jgi:hypothetical protein